jgi:2,3-bisphosphoglycerate-dependent phosphoglycerate mutase
MSIFLVRHGETPLNVARVLQPPDTPLSPTGLAQAQAVARRLAGLGVSAILSSDLPRAWQTARAIAEATGAPITPTELLHERNFGELRGQPYDALGFNPLTSDDAPPGGESTPQFHRRVALAFEQLVAMRAGLAGNLAVVTHGLVIRALLANHLPAIDGGTALLKVGNTSVTVCGAVAPHTVELLDCTRHLEATIAHDGKSLSGG